MMLFANFKIKMANFEMELRGGEPLIFFFLKKMGFESQTRF